MRTPAPFLLILTALAAGCSSNQPPTVPNPFNTADRVPPPALQMPSGGAQPYYQPGAPAPGGPTTFAPGQMAPSGYPAAPGGLQGGPPAPAYTPSPAPGSATPYYGAGAAAPSAGQVAGGDSIAIPTDAGSLRFAGQADVELARRRSAPIDRTGTATRLASNPSPRPPATASAWIAGSAPVRPATTTPGPRVRLPGAEFTREPVSLAALDRGVRIAPLEPAPTGGRPGEPAPLRVASPPSSTGWR